MKKRSINKKISERILKFVTFVLFLSGILFFSPRSAYSVRTNDDFRSSFFMRSILNAVPVPVFYKDRQGLYIGCNEAFAEMMGVSSEKIAGKSVYDLWPGDLAETYHQADIDLMEHPRHQVYEYKIYDKDGALRPVIFGKKVFYNSKGEVAGLAGAFVDITEQKKHEKFLNFLVKCVLVCALCFTSLLLFLLFRLFAALKREKKVSALLRESNKRYDELASQSRTFTWEITIDGLYTYAGPAVKDLTGYRPEELVGMKYFYDLRPKPERDEFKRQWFELFKKRKSFVDYDSVLVHKAGYIVQVSGSGFPLFDKSGKIYGYRGSEIDITDRKNAENAIKKQLKEKETLLREVNHRVKNNIAGIESFLSLQMRATDQPQVKNALQDTVSRVQSMRVLYEKILSENQYQTVSVKSYTDGLIDSLLDVFGSGKEVAIQKSIEDFQIDPKKAIYLGIFVNELLTNVFKYAFYNRDGGTVFVSITKSAKRITLVVQDDGIGFDDSGLNGKSSGFGLEIVKMLAEQLKGTYTIRRFNGTISTVEFVFD